MRFSLADLVDPRLLPLVGASRDFYAQRTARRGPTSWEELDAVRAVAAVPALTNPTAANERVEIEDRLVSIRVHKPADGAATGVLLDLHGGGFYLGSPADRDVHNRRLADTLGIAVVGVHYRLAPEHPWPAAPDDCEAAALWLAEHAETRFGTANLAVGGFSAGATLAMTTLLRLRDRGVAAFGSAVLQFGTYDLSSMTPAGRLIAGEYFLQAYASAAPDRTHPDLSPIYADLAALPPVLVIVGDGDVLLQDNLAMATRLSAAGVKVDLRVYPASPHGFTGHATPMAQAALDDIDTWLQNHLTTAGR